MSLYMHRTCAVPAPHLHRTCTVPTPYLHRTGGGRGEEREKEEEGPIPRARHGFPRCSSRRRGNQEEDKNKEQEFREGVAKEHERGGGYGQRCHTRVWPLADGVIMRGGDHARSAAVFLLLCCEIQFLCELKRILSDLTLSWPGELRQTTSVHSLKSVSS